MRSSRARVPPHCCQSRSRPCSAHSACWRARRPSGRVAPVASKDDSKDCSRRCISPSCPSSRAVSARCNRSCKACRCSGDSGGGLGGRAFFVTAGAGIGAAGGAGRCNASHCDWRSCRLALNPSSRSCSPAGHAGLPSPSGGCASSASSQACTDTVLCSAAASAAPRSVAASACGAAAAAACSRWPSCAASAAVPVAAAWRSCGSHPASRTRAAALHCRRAWSASARACIWRSSRARSAANCSRWAGSSASAGKACHSRSSSTT